MRVNKLPRVVHHGAFTSGAGWVENDQGLDQEQDTGNYSQEVGCPPRLRKPDGSWMPSVRPRIGRSTDAPPNVRVMVGGDILSP